MHFLCKRCNSSPRREDFSPSFVDSRRMCSFFVTPRHLFCLQQPVDMSNQMCSFCVTPRHSTACRHVQSGIHSVAVTPHRVLQPADMPHHMCVRQCYAARYSTACCISNEMCSVGVAPRYTYLNSLLTCPSCLLSASWSAGRPSLCLTHTGCAPWLRHHLTTLVCLSFAWRSWEYCRQTDRDEGFPGVMGGVHPGYHCYSGHGYHNIGRRLIR